MKPLRGAIERMPPFGGCLCGWWHRQCRPATERAGDEGRDGTKFWMLPPVDKEYSSKLILWYWCNMLTLYTPIVLSSWMVYWFSPHFPENLDSWWEWKAPVDSSHQSWSFAIFCHQSGVLLSPTLKVQIRQDLSTCSVPFYRKSTSTPLLGVALVEDVCF